MHSQAQGQIKFCQNLITSGFHHNTHSYKLPQFMISSFSHFACACTHTVPVAGTQVKYQHKAMVKY